MSETPKTALEIQVEQESKELANVPKEPVAKFAGTHKRCHICGRLYDANDSRKYDTHIPGSAREACPFCHPQRGI